MLYIILVTRKVEFREQRLVIHMQARSQGGQGGHDPPMKLTVACAAGHFAPVRSATKRKVVQTLAQFPPPVLI